MSGLFASTAYAEDAPGVKFHELELDGIFRGVR